jgi:hypothetical protein
MLAEPLAPPENDEPTDDTVEPEDEIDLRASELSA